MQVDNIQQPSLRHTICVLSTRNHRASEKQDWLHKGPFAFSGKDGEQWARATTVWPGGELLCFPVLSVLLGPCCVERWRWRLELKKCQQWLVSKALSNSSHPYKTQSPADDGSRIPWGRSSPHILPLPSPPALYVQLCLTPTLSASLLLSLPFLLSISWTFCPLKGVIEWNESVLKSHL